MRGVYLTAAICALFVSGCFGADGPNQPPRPSSYTVPLAETPASVTATATPLSPAAAANAGTLFPPPGELGLVAFIRGGDVWMKALPHGDEVQVTTGGGYIEPAWSPSGEWLAVQRNPRTVLLSRDGERFEVSTADRADWAWSPDADELAFMTAREPSELHLINPVSRSDRVVWRPETGLAGVRFAWSGDGTQIAVGMRPSPPSQPITKEQAGEAGTGAALLVVDTRSGAARELTRATHIGGSYIPAAFTADGRWIVTYESPTISASLAADGMPLMAIEAATGRVFDSGAHALLNADTVAIGPFPVAIVAGSGRQAWSHKTLWVASFPARSEPGAGAVPGLPEGVQGFPAWGRSDGLLMAFVTGRELPDSTSSTAAALIEMQRRIWVYNVAAATAEAAFDDVGIREEHPEWSADGRRLLFVRITEDEASLWLGETRDEPRLVVEGLLPELNTGFHGFYGNVSWEQLYDWWEPGRPAWMRQ